MNHNESTQLLDSLWVNGTNRNSSTVFDADADAARDRSSRSCNVLISTNSTLPLAANWENIPETLLLNVCVGAILYCTFYLLTRIAWSRSYTEVEYINQGIISFLYGYRDPERWYLIPRLEFLGRSVRHHNHDLNSSSIYIPPRQPLLNPIDLFSYESKRRTISLDERSIRREHPHGNQPAVKSTVSLGESGSAIKSPVVVAKKSDPPDGINTSKASKTATAKEVSPLSQSFFYPSILQTDHIEASALSQNLNRIFGWFFRVTDADIIYAKGIDAYEYLLFQRHLIFVMFVTNIICLGILLPIHWFSGETDANKKLIYTSSFQRTTIKNMTFTSMYYWAHIVSSITIVIVTIWTLSSYRESIASKKDNQLARRTLLIGNIPKHQRKRHKLVKIFNDYFSRCKVEAIQFVYDHSKLEMYQMQLDATVVAKEYCLYLKREQNREVWVKPTDVNESQLCSGYCRLCSFFYVCCCVWPVERVQPGTIFYVEKEKYYRDKISETCEYLVKHPSEYAFVTLKTNKQARRVMEELTKMKNEAAASLGDVASALRFGKAAPRSRSHESKKKQSQSLFLVTQNNDPATADPLDPNNNPYVRSIRSPSSISKHTSENGEIQASKSPLNISKATPKAIDVPACMTNPKDITKTSANSTNSSAASSFDFSTFTGPLGWSSRYAPHPDNVQYYDLLIMATTNKWTYVLLHLLMVIIFIFITTPNVLLSILERWSLLQPSRAEEITGFRGMLINYVTVLIQVVTSAVLPQIIVLISRQIPYEDTSSKNHSVMWKTFLFLVLMVIIMPSIGMSSAQALVDTGFTPECMFPTDNGAYFINYIISTTFLSTIIELIKPIDIVFYCFILWTARSRADFEGGRQYISREFAIHMQYASVLLNFSAVMAYTISCPLIAPFGLIYLIVKHSVDHYHIFYTYFTMKVDKKLQGTVEIFVRSALLLMLLQTAVAINVNTGSVYFSVLSQIVLCVTMAVFLFNCFYNITSTVIRSSIPQRHRHEFCACFYLPRVFDDLLRRTAIPFSCISRKV